MYLFVFLQTENSLSALVARSANRGRGRGVLGYIGPLNNPLQPGSRSSSVESVLIPPSQMHRQASTENPFRAPTPTGKFEISPQRPRGMGYNFSPCDISKRWVNYLTNSDFGVTCQHCCVITLICICRRLQPEPKSLAHPPVGDGITTCL